MILESHEVKLANGASQIVIIELSPDATPEQRDASRKAQLADAAARLGAEKS